MPTDKNVTWKRVTTLKKTAIQVCDLLRKGEPVPTDLLASLEELANRKRKPSDPRMLEMFAAGAKVEEIAAVVGLTPASVYTHRRRWLEKNPTPVAEVEPEAMPGDSVFAAAYAEATSPAVEGDLLVKPEDFFITPREAREILSVFGLEGTGDNEDTN